MTPRELEHELSFYSPDIPIKVVVNNNHDEDYLNIKEVYSDSVTNPTLIYMVIS